MSVCVFIRLTVGMYVRQSNPLSNCVRLCLSVLILLCSCAPLCLCACPSFPLPNLVLRVDFCLGSVIYPSAQTLPIITHTPATLVHWLPRLRFHYPSQTPDTRIIRKQQHPAIIPPHPERQHPGLSSSSS